MKPTRHFHDRAEREAIDREPRLLAHANGPDTAKAAAAASRMRRSSHRLALLRTYALTGAQTTYSAWKKDGWRLHEHRHGMDLAETRRRATDLLNAGLLERTGDVAVIVDTGKKAEVLAISYLGRLTLETLDKGA